MTDHAPGTDPEMDVKRFAAEVKRFSEEASGYSARAHELQMQTKNLLDGMVRLNAEVMKLNIRMGDVESKIGLASQSSHNELEDIVRSLRNSRKGIRESHRDLKIVLPVVTPPNGISRKGLL